ncbi:MAG: hypothetical protein IJD97_02990 [Clostridia bacterium]|nr:hypothetical protein [Clostridia bacterium]
MYKIHPVEERIIAKSICPELSENEILFVVNEEGKFTGKSICEFIEDTVYVKNLTAPYDDARTLMFLNMLNYAERRGIKKAVCINKELDDLCKRYGFDENMAVSLEGFFAPGAHCNHE